MMKGDEIHSFITLHHPSSPFITLHHPSSFFKAPQNVAQKIGNQTGMICLNEFGAQTIKHQEVLLATSHIYEDPTG